MNRLTIFLKLGLVLAVLTCCVQSDVQADQASHSSDKGEIKILGIGNSFTRNAFALLQPMGNQSKKCSIVLGKGIIGGCSMEKHMRLARLHDADPNNSEGKPYALWVTDGQEERVKVRVSLRGLLVSDTWDVVTIQQLSAQSTDITNYRPYARELYDYIKEYAPQAEILIHQTWAYRADGDFHRVFPDSPSYDQAAMYRDLDTAYNTIAAELGLRLIPVGAAFQLSREVRPFIPDQTTEREALAPPHLPMDKNSLCVGWNWRKSEPPTLHCDTHHAGIQGEYLAAAVWFEFLTGLNPHAEGIRVGDLASEDAEFLSAIAHRVVAEGKRPAISKN